MTETLRSMHDLITSRSQELRKLQDDFVNLFDQFRVSITKQVEAKLSKDYEIEYKIDFPNMEPHIKLLSIAHRNSDRKYVFSKEDSFWVKASTHLGYPITGTFTVSREKDIGMAQQMFLAQQAISQIAPTSIHFCTLNQPTVDNLCNVNDCLDFLGSGEILLEDEIWYEGWDIEDTALLVEKDNELHIFFTEGAHGEPFNYLPPGSDLKHFIYFIQASSKQAYKIRDIIGRYNEKCTQ